MLTICKCFSVKVIAVKTKDKGAVTDMEERLRRGSSIWMPAAAGAELLHRGKTVWQEIRNSGYLAFWTFFAGGIAGYCLETIWCWFAFGGFSSRTSNLFFSFKYCMGRGSGAHLHIHKRKAGHAGMETFYPGLRVLRIV